MGVEHFIMGGVKKQVIDDFSKKASEILNFAGFKWNGRVITPRRVKMMVDRLIKEVTEIGVSDERPTATMSTGGIQVTLAKEDSEIIMYVSVFIENWYYV